jgi:uncharacterized repeat protein (TIGR04138 family)
MEQDELLAELETIIGNDPRYKLESYLFVINSLEFTMLRLGRRGHVSGCELLEGIKGLAGREFGPMAKIVFESWGVTKTEDFGEIVFRLVDAGVLGKTEEDSRDDFKDIYDFSDVFDKHYDWNIGGVI